LSFGDDTMTDGFLCCLPPRGKKNITLKDDDEKDAREVRLQAFFREERRRSVLAPDVDNNVLLEASSRRLDDVRLDGGVFLWEVENLGNSKLSEAPSGMINHMGGTDYTQILLNEKKAGKLRSRRLSTFVADIPQQSVRDLSDTRTHYNKLIGARECVLVDIVRKPNSEVRTRAFVRAGPRRELHFNPETVNAAIVTCGGLCPGLNNVIRELTNSLIHTYGIHGTVWGIRGGFRGFYDPEYEPAQLTTSDVENIHHKGGTVLTSSRGGFDLRKTISFIEKYDIKQLYIVGGDGTHRGAFRIHEECVKRVSQRLQKRITLQNISAYYI